MKEIKRRDFVRLSGASALALGLAPGNAFGHTITKNVGGLREVRRGVFTYRDFWSTTTCLRTEDGLVIVDGQIYSSAERLWKLLQAEEAAPLNCLVNAHFHIHGTHGNLYLSEHAENSIAHVNTPLRLKAYADRRYYNELDEAHYPKDVFESEYSFTSGSETIHLKHYGPAHTDGDITVYFEKANVLHVGDLVFNRTVPRHDRSDGGSIKGWIEVLDSIYRDLPDGVRLVFGDGSEAFGVVGLPKDVLVMREFLEASVQYVEDGIALGRSVEEVSSAKVIPQFPEFNRSMRYRTDVSRLIREVYAEVMEAEKPKA